MCRRRSQRSPNGSSTHSRERLASRRASSRRAGASRLRVCRGLRREDAARPRRGSRVVAPPRTRRGCDLPRPGLRHRPARRSGGVRGRACRRRRPVAGHARGCPPPERRGRLGRGRLLTYEHEGDPPQLVHSRNALHHLPDFWKGVALSRIQALLAPGGVLVLRDLVYDFEPADADRRIEEWLDGAAPTPAEGWTRAELESHVRDEHSTFAWLLEALLEHAGSRPSSATCAVGSTRRTCAVDRDVVRGSRRGGALPRRDRRDVPLRLPRTGLHGRRALGLGRLRRARRSRGVRGAFDREFPYEHGRRSRSSPRHSKGFRHRARSTAGTRRHTREVVLDKTGGELTRVVAEQESLPAGSRDSVVREALDGYVNQTYRSLRYGTRLDAVEAIPHACGRSSRSRIASGRTTSTSSGSSATIHSTAGAPTSFSRCSIECSPASRGAARALQADRGARRAARASATSSTAGSRTSRGSAAAAATESREETTRRPPRRARARGVARAGPGARARRARPRLRQARPAGGGRRRALGREPAAVRLARRREARARAGRARRRPRRPGLRSTWARRPAASPTSSSSAARRA